MTAEGWDGKSLRHHVEAAHGLAQDAHAIAQGSEEKLDALLGAIERVGAGQADILTALKGQAGRSSTSAKSAPPEQAAQALRRDAGKTPPANPYPKVKRIKSEIVNWLLFLVEVENVHTALREWHGLTDNLGRNND